MLKDHPVSNVIWVPIEQVEANDYNPNAVAVVEMDLLYHSIRSDGVTQPIVTFFDQSKCKYIVVDGFHRYTIIKTKRDISDSTDGKIPIVVIDKPIDQRMASTIRHNRARGKHKIDAMSDIIIDLKRRKWTDEKICKELGMDLDEVLRLSQVKGLASMFVDHVFSEAWDVVEEESK